MRQLPQTENVPPRAASTLRTVLIFFENLKVIRGVTAAFGKRHYVIQVMLSRVKAFSSFVFPFCDFETPKRCWDTAHSCWSHRIDQESYQNADRDGGRTKNRSIPLRKYKCEQTDQATKAQIVNVECEGLPSSFEAQKQQWQYQRKGDEAHGLIVHDTPKGKFGSALLSLFLCLRVNYSFLSIVLLCYVAMAIPAAGQTARYTQTQIGGLTALLPDPAVTPGLVRPDATLESVCHGGSTKQFRKTTAEMKAKVYAQYGAKKKLRQCCEVDHLISLELGGADDVRNLWPEPYTPRPGAHEKDSVENYLHAQVCNGKMDLAEAQRAIVANWLDIYVRMPKKR